MIFYIILEYLLRLTESLIILKLSEIWVCLLLDKSRKFIFNKTKIIQIKKQIAKKYSKLNSRGAKSAGSLILDPRKDLHLAESFWAFPLCAFYKHTIQVRKLLFDLIWVYGIQNKLNFCHLTLVITNSWAKVYYLGLSREIFKS